MANFCERCNEASRSITRAEFNNELSDCQLLKKEHSAWSYHSQGVQSIAAMLLLRPASNSNKQSVTILTSLPMFHYQRKETTLVAVTL